jgi:hypothetical protein
MTKQSDTFADAVAPGRFAPETTDDDRHAALQPLFQLVYASTYAPGRITSARTALNSIVASSRAHNEASGVSSCLIFDGRSFVQVLEGPAQSVQTIFRHIRRDRRHREIFLAGSRSCDRRALLDTPMVGILSPGIFAEHGLSGDIDSRRLSADAVLALAERLTTVNSECTA